MYYCNDFEYWKFLSNRLHDRTYTQYIYIYTLYIYTSLVPAQFFLFDLDTWVYWAKLHRTRHSINRPIEFLFKSLNKTRQSVARANPIIKINIHVGLDIGYFLWFSYYVHNKDDARTKYYAVWENYAIFDFALSYFHSIF